MAGPRSLVTYQLQTWLGWVASSSGFWWTDPLIRQSGVDLLRRPINEALRVQVRQGGLSFQVRERPRRLGPWGKRGWFWGWRPRLVVV